MDPFQNCTFRNDRVCTAAPFYGSCDCEWAVDKDECPEPLTAIKSIKTVKEPAWLNQALNEGDGTYKP